MPQIQPEPYQFYELPTCSLNSEPCSRIGADLLHPETVAARYGMNPDDLQLIEGISRARCTVKYRGGPYFPYDLYDRGMLARWEATSMVNDLARWQAGWNK